MRRKPKKEKRKKKKLTAMKEVNYFDFSSVRLAHDFAFNLLLHYRNTYDVFCIHT